MVVVRVFFLTAYVSRRARRFAPASPVRSLSACGDVDGGVLICLDAALEVRAAATLALVRRVDAAHFAPGPPAPTLVCADLAPDASHPAAVVVATSDGLVAVRALRGADGWADRRASSAAGLNAHLAKRATQVLGFASSIATRGSEIASATRDVVGEARASIRGSSTLGKLGSLFRSPSA